MQISQYINVFFGYGFVKDSDDLETAVKNVAKPAEANLTLSLYSR